MSDWEAAVHAAQTHKAEDIVVLDIQAISSFTDKFVLCSGTNSRQVQSISDAILKDLRAEGVRPFGIEGYSNADWILMDYGHFVVHVFSATAREFYSLERLWKTAPRVDVPEPAVA